MPLFECPKCGVIENTATGYYWTAKSSEDAACSECHTGKWHGRFPRQKASEGWAPEEPNRAASNKPKFTTKPTTEDFGRAKKVSALDRLSEGNQ